MASLTLDYKKSDEYLSFKNHILSESPSLPEYLIDMAISLHLSKPLMYRDKKQVRADLLKSNKKKPSSETNDHLDGAVHISGPITMVF